MSDSFTIDLKIKENVLNNLNRLNGEFPTVISNGINQTLLYLKGYIQRSKLSGNPLKVRSGRLRSSINIKAVGKSGDSFTGSLNVGTNLTYAKILETGGTITPRNGQYLAIPLGALKTKSGVSRGSSPRDFNNTFVKSSRSGNLIIFEKLSNKSIRPLFLLKRSVRIPAFKYVSSSIQETKSKLSEVMNSALDALMRKIGFK